MSPRAAAPLPRAPAARSTAESAVSRSVRMEDVARLAGVSPVTVSRVLNNPGSVRPGRRDLVLAAIAELGYRRNTAARALVTRRSGLIGVVIADLNQFGPSSTLLALEAAARDTGYSLTLAGLTEISADALHAAAQHLLDQAVEALVVVVAHRAALRLTQSLDLGVPVIVVEGDLSAMPLTAGVDQVEGAHLATEHLLALGHKTVHHLAGPSDWIEAVARRQGWEATLSAAGRAIPGVLEGDWSARSGYAHGRTIAAQKGATAVFVANDQMALGLLAALEDEGIGVPGDVSVVGFDNIPEAEFFHPPLTTVRQDFTELGRRTMNLIERVLDGERDATATLLTPELVVRRSTSAPPG